MFELTVELSQLETISSHAKEFEQLIFFYEAGLEQLETKMNILKKGYQYDNMRCPINRIQTRIKSVDSIIGKMKKRNLDLTYSCLINNIYDIAGMRVICPFLNDIYTVQKYLLNQSDIVVMETKDYIKNPKPNGYRSLHMIILVDVSFSDTHRKIPVEVQIRTIAMDSWASLEHQINYKKENHHVTDDMKAQLKQCADISWKNDLVMQNLLDQVE